MRGPGRRNNPLHVVVPLVIIALVVVVLLKHNEHPPAQDQKPGTYLFCFWNVENLFDDRFDERTGLGDREYDEWYSRDALALKRKLEHLSKALIELNHGRGPDILALAEVESDRAAELLQKALNARLTDESLHYSEPIMKKTGGGRHIAPAVLTRLPVERNRTQILKNQYRILEAHLNVNGQELVVLASHWSSRLSDKTGKTRGNYGDLLHGRYKAMVQTNPSVDLLVCGDFNDDPDEPSVTRHLQAVADRDAVQRSSKEKPLLFNLSAGRDPKQHGTHYYRGWFVFDQIVVSPGLLDDQGWTCDPPSLLTINTLAKPGDSLRRPWKFGNEDDTGERGTSDHFPVTVQLGVGGRMGND